MNSLLLDNAKSIGVLNHVASLKGVARLKRSNAPSMIINDETRRIVEEAKRRVKNNELSKETSVLP